MPNQRVRWLDNIESPTVYSHEQYQQLRDILGSPDRAEDWLDVSKTEIHELCMRLMVGDEVVDEAIQLYQQVIRTDLVNNYSNGALMAATVYAACRKYEEPRTMQDVSDAASVLVEQNNDSSSQQPGDDYRRKGLTSRTELQRTYNKIRNRFDRRYSPVEPEKFAQRYCDELKLGEQVEEFVRVAITQADSEALAGRDPNSIAAGAIYYASEKLGIGMTQREVGAVTRCTVRTIGEMRTVIKDSIEP